MQKEINKTVKRLKEESVFELLHYHEKNKNQKLKNIIKRAAGRYVPPEDLIFWPTGLLANVLAENLYYWDDKDKVMEALKVYFDRWIIKGMPLYYVDDVLCGVALIDLYILCGEEKYKAGADKMAQYLYSLYECEADGAGSIPYRSSQKNGHIYVDAIGMICPFLSRYGAEFSDSRAIDIAALHIKNMMEYGMDKEKFLPYHGYEYESKTKYGIIGWGRAIGWMLGGMAETLVNMPEEHELYSFLTSEFLRLVKAVSVYQKENGAFAWQLEAGDGPEDSSATAMIAASLIKGRKFCDTGCKEIIRKATDYLVKCESDGKIAYCSGECLGFAQYPQIYGAYPWSLGPGLEVIKSALAAWRLI